MAYSFNKNKLIVSHKTPYGTIKGKINYNLNEGNATMKYNVNKIEDLMGHLISILAKKGYSGIMPIRRTFMIIDENSNKEITFDEFEKLFKKYRYELSEEEINNLFNYFDKDGSGFIDYDEFFNLLIEKSDDNLEVNEIKVDFDDFCEFYKNISVCIEDDKYFEVKLQNIVKRKYK